MREKMFYGNKVYNYCTINTVSFNKLLKEKEIPIEIIEFENRTSENSTLEVSNNSNKNIPYTSLIKDGLGINIKSLCYEDKFSLKLIYEE